MTALSEDPRFARLPKWAQQGVRTLERRTLEACQLAERARLDTDPAGSDTLLGKGFGDQPIGLGRGTRVRFVLDPDGPDWRSYVDVHVERDSKGAYLHVHGAGGLGVVPHVSNVLYVELRSDR